MKKIDKLHAYSSIIQKILNLPESYDGYLQLTLLYVDQDRIKEAQKAVYLALISIEKNENIKTIVSCLRERYNPNKFEYFLKLIHDTSRSLSEPTEVEGCRLLIQAIDLFLTEITVYDRPNSLFLWWGYFKNILKQYIGGKHCLNSYSESFGDNLFSYRTMAESLLGAWDLSYNHHSGVDFSILQDYHQFSLDAQISLDAQSYCISQKSHDQKEEKPTSRAIVFLSCDGTYFERLAIAQALSIYESSPNVGVHFHVMNPTLETPKWIGKIQCACPGLRVSCSFEQVNYGVPQSWDRKTYYASARFCRAASFINTINTEKTTVIITDADQLFRKNILSLLNPGVQKAYDIAIFDHLETIPLASLYAKFGASFVAINSTASAKQYIRDVSFFIEKNLNRLACWTLDQIALFTVAKLYNKNNTPISILKIPGEEITCAWDSNLNSTIWNSAGPCKFQINTYTNTIRYFLRKYGFQTILKRYY